MWTEGVHAEVTGFAPLSMFTSEIRMTFYTLEGRIDVLTDRMKIENELVRQETRAESKEMMWDKEK